MSAKTDIWMPLYIGDYLRDTTRLTTAQHGAYLLLIMDYWTNGAPPDDDEVLASITKSSPEDWVKMRAVLMPKFDLVDGVWRHGRIDAEIADAQENRRKNLERSQKANLAKAAKATSKETYKEPEEDRVEVTPSPSPSPSQKTSSTKKNTRANFQKPVDVSDVTWVSFVTNCRAKQKPPTDLVMLKIRAEATKAGLTLEQALVFACERSWARFEHEWWVNENNKQGHQQRFTNQADVARVTVPDTGAAEDTKRMLEQRDRNAGPPPAEVRAKMAELLGHLKVKP